MHINSVLSTYFWDIKVRTFLLLDFYGLFFTVKS